MSVDRATGVTYESVVNLSEGAVEQAEAKPGLHAPVLAVEWLEATPAVLGDSRVQEALRERGITDLDTVIVEPWPAAYFGEEVDHLGRRIGRAILFLREHDGDTLWARPIEGLLVIADRSTGEVVEVRDSGATPVPSDPGRMGADDPGVGPLRGDLTPLVITQPDGPSFTLEGSELRWQRWSMRISIHPIDGLVLHQIAYDDPATGRIRPICYRASLSEMVVPYGDPGPLYYWRHVFDAGEAALGKNTQSLTLGCDCVGEVHYVDAPMIGHDGQPTVIANAVCVHEEDAGVLWRHADWRSELAHVRRSRRLVVSSWANLGNYDYGFFWYFYLDGTIEAEVKLTGVPAAAAHHARPTTHPRCPRRRRPVGTASPAPVLFPARPRHRRCRELDRGSRTRHRPVQPGPSERQPPSTPRPHRCEPSTRRVRDASPAAGRFWKVSAAHARNGVGEPTAYALIPGAQPALLAGTGSAVARRAEFARHHLWVTQHADGELHAAGDYPNQHPGGDGLPRLHRRQPLTRAHRRRVVVHLRIEPRRPPGGLAGDARGVRRIPPPARRLLRPQPGARRATTGPHQPERTLPVTAGGKRRAAPARSTSRHTR